MLTVVVFQSTHHRPADLVLAAIIALVTFKVSYRACVVLGTVLLQTAPRRGLSSGKMEAFLRVMREVTIFSLFFLVYKLINFRLPPPLFLLVFTFQVERHPNVLHLPAPHIWQLTPSSVHSVKDEAGETLIVTVQLHVRDDLGDDEILSLTRWTWERCVRALGGGGSGGGMNGVVNGNHNGGEKGKGGVEVTVGVVRG